MKKLKILLLLLIMINLLVGCAATANDLSQQIVPPNNAAISIKGTWEITEVLNHQHQSIDPEGVEEWVGKEVQFDNQAVAIGEELIRNPRYQVKQVNQREYLLYHYKAFPADFRFKNKEIEVITIIDQELFYCEVIQEDTDKLVLKIYNDSFLLEKVSETVDENLLKGPVESLASTDEPEETEGLIRTGVIIGLRQEKEKSQDQIEYDYRTLWINSQNRDLNPPIEMEELLFPRRSGFWRLSVDLIEKYNYREDYFSANQILTREVPKIQVAGAIEPEQDTRKDWLIERKINYIGNDYVSIEEEVTFTTTQQNTRVDSRLKLIPIDSLYNNKAVSIEDLLGKAGIEALEEGLQQAMEGIPQEANVSLDSGYTNFGLERRLGHWFFKGRLNYEINGEYYSKDYNINLIPPPKLVVYDDLSITWTHVKDKVPSAIDVYTSPNEELALVVTKNELLVYGIVAGRLQKEPLERIPLRENETIIMAEWATGPYVEIWERNIGSYLQFIQLDKELGELYNKSSP